MNFKKLSALAFFTALLTFNGLSQLTPVAVCLGTDATVCLGQSVVITNCGTGGGGSLGALNLNSPSSVSLSDDAWSAAVPIGFTFSYYGTNYTQCVIGSNGVVSFKLSNAGGYCPWSLNGTPIPNAGIAGASNSAMGLYTDMNPVNASSGPIQYQTIGTAPNRIFAVLYKGVTAYSCTSSCSYVAFLFYEGSNIIEYHIGSKQVCTWNSGLAIQGVQNLAGNIGTATPGRNNTVWTASQDGKRFSPTSATNTNAYAVTTIPYINVTSSGSAGAGLQWQSTLNQTFPYNGGVLTVSNVPAGTTGYFLTGTSCGVSIGSVSDTSFITRTSASVTTTSIGDTCGAGSGSVTAIPGAGTAPYTFNWATLGATTATVNNVSAGTYTVNITDANGCPATSTVAVTNIPSTTSSSNTLVSCPGGSDGTATAEMLPLGVSTTYLWDDPAAQTTQTAVGLQAGTYNCTITSSNGCVEIVEVIVTEIPGMIGTTVNQQDVTCYTGNDGIIQLSVTQGTGPYSYSWSGSATTDSIATDLYVGPQQVDITDANGCLITLNTVLSEPMPLVLSNVTTDTMICPEATITLGAVGGGGSSPYSYTWFENGVQISTDQYPLVDPSVTGTVYQVTLSEQCGSPTTSASLTIIFPTPIQPLAIPDPIQACAPDTFKFMNNNSVNSSEIATTFYEFSNGTSQLINGLDTASQWFQIANDYDVNMTVTSIYGCVYNNFFPSIITAWQKPKAQFGISTNPTTIFETRVKMSDKSVGALAWQWVANQASPAVSNVQNPEFFFPQVEGYYPIFLTVTSLEGCWDTITVLLNVQSDIIFYAPNTFTPDGDEHNPTWKFAVAGMDLTNFELSIYNRWGEVIWQTFDANAEWDGTFKGRPVDTGIYNWKARFKKFGKEDFQTKTGSVNVLR
jgi:gliding motility-associated-like protein|tara:strand:- start:32870 stop:35584 length:2715 start_codon:yes stop_codon:yes gene_type:complete